VCREIIADDMNLLAFGLMGNDVSEKSHKFCAGVSWCRFA